MSWFDGSRGRVHQTAWLPESEVRSVVVFLHGFGEHLGLYDAFARRLTATGHGVHALDAVGHGRSEGPRGEMIWETYVPDALTLVRAAKDDHPGVPVTLAGHSGGALAALLVALRHPDYVHALMHDPLVHDGAMPAPMLESLVRHWPEVEEGLAAGRPDLPVLMVNGELDPIVPLPGPQEVAARLPQATLRVFPGDLHDVLNEHDRDDVHEAVAEFVDRITQPAVA